MRICKRYNKQFKINKYHLSQLYYNNYHYIKNKEKYKKYKQSILNYKPRKIINLKKI
jgi:hypothetical protein